MDMNSEIYSDRDTGATNGPAGTHTGGSSRPKQTHNFPVQFEIAGGPVISGFTQDLTLKGMQLRCDQQRINQLLDSPPTEEQRAVLVVIRLKVGNRLTSQVLRCRLEYLEEFSTEEMVLGLQFDDLLPDQELALLSVLEQTGT